MGHGSVSANFGEMVFFFLMSLRYWGAVVPEVCRQSYIGEEWKCFFGAIIYPTIKSEWESLELT